HGQNQIVLVAGANGTFGVEELMKSEEVIAQAGFVLLQLEIPLSTVERAARIGKANGALVILDPAPAQSISDELLALADYVTPNETELAALTDSSFGERLDTRDAEAKARELLSRGARKVIVKMGAQGALLVAAEESQWWHAVPVTPVDTTAAGDAFNAAFAVALADGRIETEAGRFATAAAALSVTRRGAQPSMPTRGEVESLLTTTPRV
ncbi:MAG: ribokinase, partial [Acidobacteriota bacterium]|nr:ribokinase [Acidobacteriota bacterium]